MTIHYCYTECPLGKLMLVGDFQGLSQISLVDESTVLPKPHWRRDAAFFVNAIVQLKEYFAGERQRFSLRLNPAGGDFQSRVLETVACVPYGETASYADIARILKKPKATRAVANAVNNNPLLVMVPCHRVIGSNGRPTGTGDAFARRKWLLGLESGEHKSDDASAELDVEADLLDAAVEGA